MGGTYSTHGPNTLANGLSSLLQDRRMERQWYAASGKSSVSITLNHSATRK